MKKTLSLVLALLFVLALFAGCNNGGGTPATQAPGSDATAAPATQAPNSGNQPAATEEPVDEGPYHFAAGKYEKNADGFPVEKYVYDRPLTDNDDVLTKWTTCDTPH